MTTTRKSILRGRDVQELSDVMRRYFLEEPYTKNESIEVMACGERGQRRLWEKYGAELLGGYIRLHPCERPQVWWDWTSPRVGDDLLRSWGYDESTFLWRERPCEPRRRLGGVGTPNFEVLNYAPDFYHGVPAGWVSPFLSNYYNGRARDIHGNRIGVEYREGHFSGVAVNPNDPPLYESEAAYLDRHALLTEGEKAYLKDHPELMNPEIVLPPVEDDDYE